MDDTARAAWLAVFSAVCALMYGLGVPNMARAGGMEVSRVGFILLLAGAVLCAVAFCKCPRDCIVEKSVTFLCLFPVLHTTVKIILLVIGRWFDPSFGHC
jgi:hypothetical protein